MNVAPPTVIVALRACVFVFAAALKLTAPLPLPLAALVIVSQPVSLLAAAQGHPAGAAMLVDPPPPAAPTD